jgi:hypothetical protein
MIAVAIVLGPAVLAFAIALRRGHRVVAAMGIAAAEIALAAVFVPVLLFVGLVLFGLFGPHDPS